MDKETTIKGLTACSEERCSSAHCPYYADKNCTLTLTADALELVNQLQSRVDELEMLMS